MSKPQKRSKKIAIVLVFLLTVVIFLVLYMSLDNSYIKPTYNMVVSEVLSFFSETARNVGEIYWNNVEYLWTSILISIEVYFFTFILIRLVSGKILEGKEVDQPPLKHSRFFYFFTILVRRFITFINDIRETYTFVILNKHDTSREVDLNYYYLVTCLTLGIVLSIFLVASYEYNPILMWFIFLVCLFTMFPSIIALSKVDELNEDLKKIVGIAWHPPGEIAVKDGDLLLNVREGIILLGLSIGAGMVGIITTLGAILIKATLFFTIVPATFDMISLITALMEFTGLKMVVRAIKDLEGLGIGLLNMFPIISWSIYGGGVIYVLLYRLRWAASTDLILTFIASVWILIAMFSGTLSNRFKYSLKSLAKRIVLFMIPLFLLLIH